MLTSSSAPVPVLFRPTIPLTDPAKSATTRHHPHHSEWSALSRAAAAAVIVVGGGCPAPHHHLDVSPMSDVHVCPYPRRGILSSCSAAVATGQRGQHGDITNAIPGGGDHPRADPGLGNMDVYSLDYERITNTVNQLEASGWYYGQLSWQQATNMLKSKPVGTFLIRDSSDPMYLFALSVQTERGPTSIRIHYADGQFKLDAEDLLVGNMPLFDCVLKLVDYYVRLSRTDKAKAHVWLDVSGRRDRQIQLNDPLYHRVPRLQHLCRLTVNGSVPVQRINQLNLPKTLLAYIRDYPYQR